MSGYLKFTRTGVEPIDNILAALETAGRLFHNTEGWVDGWPRESDPSQVDVIQKAADEAAAEYGRRTL